MTYSGWGLGASPQSPLPPFTIETLLRNALGIFDRLRMSATKHCKRCDRVLPVSKFSKHKNSKDGLNFYCKECVSEKGEKYRERVKNDPSYIYSQLKSRIKHSEIHRVRELKPFTITLREFTEWYNNIPKICVYCDLPEEEMWAMQEDFDRRVKRLELDCKENDIGYVLGNVVLACHRCNFIKNNILTFDEMREFAQKYIKPRWISKFTNRPSSKEAET